MDVILLLLIDLKMPPLMRSNDLLKHIEGFFFIDQDKVDLAAKLYSELRPVVATFDDEDLLLS